MFRRVIIFPWYPVGNVGAGRIHARQNAGPRWRANRAGAVCLGKLHAHVAQALHIGGMKIPVVISDHISEGNTRVCPAHVINQKQ